MRAESQYLTSACISLYSFQIFPLLEPIGQSLSNWLLDSAGDLNLIARGNREKIIAEILQ